MLLNEILELDGLAWQVEPQIWSCIKFISFFILDKCKGQKLPLNKILSLQRQKTLQGFITSTIYSSLVISNWHFTTQTTRYNCYCYIRHYWISYKWKIFLTSQFFLDHFFLIFEYYGQWFVFLLGCSYFCNNDRERLRHVEIFYLQLSK